MVNAILIDMSTAFASADEERFDSNTEVLASGCHRWTGSLTQAGYGNFTYAGDKRLSAHRYAFWLKHGRLPAPPMILDHTCHNRRCVNPDHLEEVTYSVNYWRGAGPAAHREDPSKCRAGLHDWVEENLVLTNRGVTCRLCKNAAQRAAHARRTGKSIVD